jgi:hypothetical protein
MCRARHLCNRKFGPMNSARSSLLMLWLQCKMKHQTIRHCYITYTVLSSQFSQSLQTFRSQINSRFEAFTEVKIKGEDFWVVMLCNVVVGYQRFRGPCCFLLQGEVQMEAAWASESYHNTTQHHKRQDPECSFLLLFASISPQITHCG